MNAIEMRRVIKARTAVREAAKRLTQAVAEEMPIGSLVSYVHGKYVRFARVVQHCYGDDLLVVSDRGKRYRLSSWRVETVSR